MTGHCALAFALLSARLARPGAGADACLRHGSLPIPVRYHSPVPDIADLRQRRIREMAGRHGQA